jgi:PAS domain S-box-containing protein
MKVIGKNMQIWRKNISRAAAVVSERIVGAYAGAGLKECRRLPLLSAFLLITILVTLIVSLVLRNTNPHAFYVMLSTSGLLLFCYFISRTRFYKIAIIIAILAPVLPSISAVYLHPQAESVTAELLWLALPLLIASFMLSIRETIFIAISYVIYVIILATIDSLKIETSIPVLAFMVAVSFFVITITHTRIKDQAEIETQLKKLQQAGEALRENEEKFRNLFEHAKDAVFLADADNGLLLDVNRAGCEMLDLPKDKIIGREMTILHPPEMAKEFRKVFREHVRKGNVPSDDSIIQRADGTQIPASMSASVIKLKDRTIIQGVFRDVSERKQAEEALKASEEKFHTIVENSNDGIAFIKDGTIQYCNPKLLEITGYTKGDILGQPFIKFIAPDHKEKVSDIYQRRLAGQNAPDKYELDLLAKGGSIRNTEISASLVLTEQGLVDIAFIRDITRRKQVEETLAIEATRRRILIEQSRDGIVIIDQDGNVYEANQRFAEMVGYSPEEVRKLKVYDWEFLYPPERVLEMIRTVDEKGDHFETQHRRKDGTTYDVEISTNGATIADKKLIFCVCRDITERKRIEKSLRESEEKFSKSFMNTPQALVITGLDDGIILEVNDSFLKLTGYNRKELIGKKAIELNLWSSPEERENVLKILDDKGIVKNVERQFFDKAGKINTWLFSADTINLNGKPCMLSVTVDITERKEAEKKLHEIDQMKSEFLSNVSHELRTPLQSISGFTKLIMTGKVPDPATQQEFFQIIDRETTHLGNLINSLLDMSRLESGRFKIYKRLTPPYDIFSNSVKMFHSLAREKNINLTEDISPKLPEIEVDSDRMRQVVINLVSNAIKFSEPGGSVHVKARLQNNELLFQVTDHGTGIREEAMKHLFQRFYRVEGEKVKGGTGLGLYISKQIIDAHDGRIWAESKFGEGSTFSFTLPVNNERGKQNGEENIGNRRRPSHVKAS